MKRTVRALLISQTSLRHVFLICLASFFLLTGCASVPHPASSPAPDVLSRTDTPTIGLASYYGAKYHGRKTASGEIYDRNKMTAAHRTLPFGVTVRVTELSNNRSVIVRINDRGPFVRGRIIDLSLAAARQLGIVQSGQARVQVEVVRQMSAAAAPEPVRLESATQSP